MEPRVPSSVLTLKGIEAKLRPLVEALEKEVPGLQLAVVMAVPDPDQLDVYACSAYLNMDEPLLKSALSESLHKPLDRTVSIS